VPDYRGKIERKAQNLLHPGEHVLATVRAAPVGSPLAAAGGLVVLAIVSTQRAKTAQEQGFPASSGMVLAVTDRRLLVFRQNFGLKYRGELPLEKIRGVSLERRSLGLRLRFVLSSRAEVTFSTYRADHPDQFVEAVNRAVQARVPVTPPDATARPTPAVPPPPPR